MGSQTKNARALRRVVTPHTLKHARSIVQGVGHHVNSGVFPRDHFAIHPDVFASLHFVSNLRFADGTILAAKRFIDEVV